MESFFRSGSPVEGSVFVTIAIPTWNRAVELGENLEVLRHELEKSAHRDRFEVLVVDNASEDETPNLIRKFDWHLLSYFRQEVNVGYDRNIDSAVRMAKGDWVFFLADDDFLLPGGVELIFRRLIMQVGCAIALFETTFVTQEKKLLSIREEFYSELDLLGWDEIPPGRLGELVSEPAGGISGFCVVKDVWPLNKTESLIGTNWIQLGVLFELSKSYSTALERKPVLAYTIGNKTGRWSSTTNIGIANLYLDHRSELKGSWEGAVKKYARQIFYDSLGSKGPVGGGEDSMIALCKKCLKAGKLASAVFIFLAVVRRKVLGVGQA